MQGRSSTGRRVLVRSSTIFKLYRPDTKKSSDGKINCDLALLLAQQ